MANTVVGITISGRVSGPITGPSNAFGSPNINLSASGEINLSLGTDANKADLFAVSSGSVGTGGTELDMNGSLVDSFGATVSFVDVVGLLIKNTSSSGNLLVGAAATNIWSAIFGNSSDVLVIPPGGFVLFGCGNDPAWAVTAGSADKLKLASSTGTVDYSLLAIGRSA